MAGGNRTQVSEGTRLEYGEKVDNRSAWNLSVDPRESPEPQAASRRDEKSQKDGRERPGDSRGWPW